MMNKEEWDDEIDHIFDDEEKETHPIVKNVATMEMIRIIALVTAVIIFILIVLQQSDLISAAPFADAISNVNLFEWLVGFFLFSPIIILSYKYVALNEERAKMKAILQRSKEIDENLRVMFKEDREWMGEYEDEFFND